MAAFSGGHPGGSGGFFKLQDQKREKIGHSTIHRDDMLGSRELIASFYSLRFFVESNSEPVGCLRFAPRV